MKKIILIVLVSIFTFSLSCKSDDDNNNDTSGLTGTTWVKSTDSSRNFNFTSETVYAYTENGNQYPGTYTFNGVVGVMTETSSGFQFNFEINDNVLTIYQNPSEPELGTDYIKQ